MMMNARKYSFVLLWSTLLLCSVAQAVDQVADSLRIEIASAPTDSLKMERMLDLAYWSSNQGDTSTLQEIDRAMAFAQEQGLYEQMAGALTIKSGYHLFLGEYVNAEKAGQEILAIAKEHGLVKEKGYALFSLAGIDRFQGKHQEAFDRYSEAQEIFEELEMKPQVATLIFSQGVMLDFMGKFNASIEKFFEALEIYRSEGDVRGMGLCHNSIGLMNERQSNPEKAMYHYRHALAKVQQVNDQDEVGNVLANLGNVHATLNNLDSSLFYAEKAITIRRAQGAKFGLGRTLSQAALTFAELGRMDEAMKASNEAIEIFEALDDPVSLSKSLSNRASLYLKSGNILAAEADAARSLELAQTAGAPNEERDAYLYLSKAQAESGDHRSALASFRSHVALKDSIINEANAARLNELEASYEVAQKDRKILEQELEIEQRAEQERQQRMFITLLIAFGFLVGTFFFFRGRSLAEKRKADQARLEQLEAERKVGFAEAMIHGQEAERSRVAKELHDGLGALLATAKIHVNQIQSGIDALEQMQVHDKAKTIIDSAYQEVRRISHDMMPASLERFGLVKALGSLASGANSTEMAASFEDNTTDLSIKKEHEIALYRIAQEAVNNAIKYASASALNIALSSTGTSTVLTISDNGAGFDVDAAPKGGLGLENMRSRVGFLDGALRIESTLGKGTTITAEIPRHDE